MAHDLSLIGREAERATIRRALARGQGVVLVGEAGVGKTALARAGLTEAVDAGYAGAWVAAGPRSRLVPFGSFSHLLRSVRDRRAGDHLQAFLDASAALADEADGRPLVLGVDDAQLLDDLSKAFLHHLASSGQARPILTVRAEASADEGLVALWKDEFVDRVELAGLSKEESRQLVETMLDGPIESMSAEQLWHVSGGNPLFLRELVLSCIDSGALSMADGLWCSQENMTFDTARLHDLVQARLQTSDADERLCVELLAVGQPIGVSLLQTVVGASALGRLEDRQAIRVDESGRRRDVTLGHPLYAEVLNRTMTRLHAQDVKRRLAHAIRDAGSRRAGDVITTALLLIDDPQFRDADLLLRAARKTVGDVRDAQQATSEASPDVGLRGLSTSDEALALAGRFAERALDAGGGFEAAQYLVRVRFWDHSATGFAEAVRRLASEAVTNWDEAHVAYWRAMQHFWIEGCPDKALHVLVHAQDAVPESPVRLELQLEELAITTWIGDVSTSQRLGEQMLQSPDQTPFAKARVSHPLAIAYALAGRSKQALDLLDQHMGAFMAHLDDSPHLVGSALHARILALVLDGRLEEAAATAQACHETAITRRAHEAVAVFAFARGQISLRQGNAVTAERYFREFESRAETSDAFGLRRWGLAGLAVARAYQGDPEGATRTLELLSSLRPTVRLFDADVAIAQAAAATALGKLTGATGVLMAAAEGARALGQFAYEADALHEIVRLGRPQEVCERLQELGSFVEGTQAQLYARHALALVNDDPAGLLDVARGFEGIGALLLAAEASARSAEAYGRRGLSARRASANALCQALFASCEGTRSVAIQMLPTSSPLTRREGEVATLAANGLSDAAIACTLSVSVRTVESHLHNAYTKLGVTGRRQLASRLARSEPAQEGKRSGR